MGLGPSETMMGETAVLLVGFGVAAYYDWRYREVSDHLWQALGAVGVFLGAVLLAPEGTTALLTWAAVSALALEHLYPWDLAIERWDDRAPGYIEIVGFLAVGTYLGVIGVRSGVGSTGLPLPVIAAFASILLGRGLFEARLLYGGADAKALISAGIVLPLQATSGLLAPPTATGILAVYPFSLTLLMNAALLSISVPVALAIVNLRRKEFTIGTGFTGYRIPVDDLPDRFVWLKDPTFASSDEEAETAEEDRSQRLQQQSELRAQGVQRVWVTPQVPFLVLLLAGAIVGSVFGNLIFDALAYI
ncbi:MAG TPA: A24 family peptidase C-terminal domain-containing protein [Thermoplasmata archaeon]|nr:A24 family peptidase C-terminal domain-containing protein [Thermoplasmata archaeon]